MAGIGLIEIVHKKAKAYDLIVKLLRFKGTDLATECSQVHITNKKRVKPGSREAYGISLKEDLLNLHEFIKNNDRGDFIKIV